MVSQIDNASLDLMVRLQLEDANALMRGKHANEAPDIEVAAELFRHELEQLQLFMADQIMSRSIAQATLRDGDAIEASLQEEYQAAHDRDYATSINPATTADRRARATCTPFPLPLIDDEMMGKLAMMFIGNDELITSATPAIPGAPARAPETLQAESSSQGAKASGQVANRITRHCIGCEEDVSYIDAIRCPCDHDYCRSCIAGLFEAAISDESLFPARCCGGKIPLGLNQIFLPANLAGRYRAKELEYGTPNRTYCHDSSCLTFVPPQFIRGNTATCVKCHSHTCTDCKGPAHEQDCPPDAGMLDVLRMANDRGWQRCYSCHTVVELSTGCNHITCRCGAQFCYVCGDKWKSCDCEQWHENRLLDRAIAVVERDADEELGDMERAARMEEAQQHLRANHECGHVTWRHREGTYQCEECLDHLPHYIYQCANCRILACRTCRRNRL